MPAKPLTIHETDLRVLRHPSTSSSVTRGVLFLIEKQKNEQGIYPLSLTGRLGRPNIQIGKFRVPM
jgi:hypothetical protein